MKSEGLSLSKTNFVTFAALNCFIKGWKEEKRRKGLCDAWIELGLHQYKHFDLFIGQYCIRGWPESWSCSDSRTPREDHRVQGRLTAEELGPSWGPAYHSGVPRGATVYTGKV